MDLLYEEGFLALALDFGAFWGFIPDKDFFLDTVFFLFLPLLADADPEDADNVSFSLVLHGRTRMSPDEFESTTLTQEDWDVSLVDSCWSSTCAPIFDASTLVLGELHDAFRKKDFIFFCMMKMRCWWFRDRF